MQNLTNTFQLVGLLSEMRIEFKNNAIKAKFSLDYKHYSIQCNFYISKLYSLSEYNNFINILTSISPKLDTIVLLDGEEYYTVFSKENNSKLLITGNITELDSRLFFNGQHIAFTNSVENLDINIECVTVDKNRLLNICNNDVRIFNIENDMVADGKFVKMNLEYQPPYILENNIVKISNPSYNLSINSKKITDKYIAKSDIENMLIEWEIMEQNRKNK